MSTPAWQELARDEYNRLWDNFEDRFGFNPGVAPETWPAIREPTPSVTIDLSPIFAADRPRFAAGQQAVNSLTLRALTWTFADTERFVALDWQHPGYLFSAHRHAVSGEPWRITPFPDGDYYIFLTEDFRSGIFGHPWEQTLCIFGELLIAALEPPLSAWLPVKRVSAA